MLSFAFETSATVKRLSAYSGGKATFGSAGSAIFGQFVPVAADQNSIALGIAGQAYKFTTDGIADIQAGDILTVASVDYTVRGVRRYTMKRADFMEAVLEKSIKT